MSAYRFNNRDRFYEAYWSQGGKAIPEDDPTTGDRKRWLASALKQFLTLGNRPGKVLDAGCGSGEFEGFIKGLGFDVVGIDTSQAAIEQAKRLYPETNFHRVSLEDRLPFSDGEFDAIWSTEVLEHLFNVHASLSELNRVLDQGGVLILTVPFHGLLKNLIIALVGFERHYHPYVSHIRFFTQKSLTECLSLTGFQLLLCRGIGRVWPLYKSFFVVARKIKAPESAPEIIG